MGHQAWDVIRKGRIVDTVFYDKDCDPEYVRRGLIEHDGYPPDIRVEKPRRTFKVATSRPTPTPPEESQP